MYNDFLIAVDSGKSYTKYAFRNEVNVIEKGRFRTKVAEIDGSIADLTAKTDIVVYNQKKFAVGDLLSEENTNYDLTKQTEEHRLSIYLAITKVLQKVKSPTALANIHLAINTPLSLFKNEKLKQEYSQFIQQKGNVIGIEVNNRPYSFRIASIYVLPEAIGPTYSNPKDFKGRRILVCDFGSLNVSFLEINNLIPVYDNLTTSTLGINILRSKISESLTTNYGIAFNDDDIEQILKDKYVVIDGKKQEGSNALIEQLIEEHIKKIINYAKSRKISFSNKEIILVGGGSILLKKYLISHFPNAIILNDSQFANVLSFLSILEAKQHERRTKA
ncbi:ParM/StbA family protein [Alkalihalobacterium bogoriense]|uniref:ParM/StbA family protein n=1 Tax=Alkalihalobacterium bogoriense TaxID=246272 RepID=UPI00047DDBDE|nr:ParM/StbA family protein [Alkalihalobacterium bogoriense]